MIKPLSAFFLLVMTLQGCILKGPKGNTTTAMLPETNLVDASGQTVDLSSFKGKKVFVNLWATWCPPCVAEMASIEQLYQVSNKETASFVLISFDKDFETAKRWMQQKNYSVPIYTIRGDLPELFAVDGIPSTFIFNEQGQVVFSQMGQENYAGRKFVEMMNPQKQ